MHLNGGRVVTGNILGSTDGFSIPASVDDVADDVLWSPLRCGCDDPMGVPDDAADAVATAASILLRSHRQCASTA